MSDKLPPRNEWGVAVPKGGSSCASCEYYLGNMKCGSKGFIAWDGPNKPAGSDKIPAKTPDSYCSIWWGEGKGGARRYKASGEK